MSGPSLETRTAFHGHNRLKLGLFGANCSSGRVPTLVDEVWSGNWEDNLRLAQMADSFGLDFLLPLGRWRGYGATDYEGSNFETLTWAAGLLAQTKRITAFATVHAPLLHPVLAAKQMVTIDHMSRGRFGLNIVCGWNEDEFGMFGASVREHDQRYAYAQEWIDAIRRLWGPEDDFDFDGRYIQIKGGRAHPKPYGGSRPVLMNAGHSEVGIDYAVRNCDAMFNSVQRDQPAETIAEIEKIKGMARQHGRDIGVFTAGVVVCRKTDREAQDYFRHCTEERVDRAAVDGILAMRRVDVVAMAPAERDRIRRRYTSGMGGVPIVGDPDTVANQLAELHRLGIGGFAFSLVNFIDELPFLCSEVLPRLRKMGLRSEVSN